MHTYIIIKDTTLTLPWNNLLLISCRRSCVFFCICLINVMCLISTGCFCFGLIVIYPYSWKLLDVARKWVTLTCIHSWFWHFINDSLLQKSIEPPRKQEPVYQQPGRHTREKKISLRAEAERNSSTLYTALRYQSESTSSVYYANVDKSDSYGNSPICCLNGLPLSAFGKNLCCISCGWWEHLWVSKFSCSHQQIGISDGIKGYQLTLLDISSVFCFKRLSS